MRVDDAPDLEARAVEGLNGGALTLSLAEGRQSVPLDELRRIELAGRQVRPAEFALKLWARPGQVFYAKGLEADAQGRLSLHGEGWQASGLPLSDVRAVATWDFLREPSPKNVRQFAEVLRQPPADADLLVVVAEGREHRLRGRVPLLDPEGVRAAFEEKESHLAWSRIRWLVLSAPAGDEPAGRFRLRLTDGSVIVVDEIRWEGSDVTAARGPATVQLKADGLVQVDASSERCRYLSDLEPVEVKLTPFFDVAWPPRPDGCVAGGPIVLEGRTYERGVGTGTRTEMTYRLGGAYTHFYATVGVDDSAGPRGHVVFAVLADGKELFRSPVMTGASPSVRVAVPLGNAEAITIVSDFGSKVRADGDFADWAEARLVRAGAAPEQP